MKVVLLPAPYTPERAAAGLAFGLAAPPSALVPGGVVVPPDPLPPPADAAAAGRLPVVRAERYVMADGRLKVFAFARALNRAAATPGAGGVAVDATSPAFALLDPHWDRSAEISRVVARAFYWQRERPVVVQFCHPPLLRFHVREWVRLIGGESLETLREDPRLDPGHRLRFHMQNAAVERHMHHPGLIAKRAAKARVKRTLGRLKFWRWFRT